MTTIQKKEFLGADLFRELENLEPGQKPLWGIMNARQMVEHAAAFFDVSSGIIEFDQLTPEEYLPKYREFLYSDKPFRENTKAPVTIVPEVPKNARYEKLEDSVNHLQKSVNSFFGFFNTNPSATPVHPVFGPLSFDEWIMLHYKHMIHHMKQFGLAVE